ncbi:hypothetical protein LWI28_005761 [Acer negundo]|uniref:Mediator of RNA polymerase II transcription subunit 28 n=1 Tax=Acer negundo TaxID=4023 RepID=A0AAD5IKQ2_ACENE|nr:hypothetical protein LWI28_005761 [Acer negundo]KAK4841768.1 hypothetical protein QYF36_010105 [Acer negundo]
MAENQSLEKDDQQMQLVPQQQTLEPPSIQVMITCVDAMEAALIPCMTKVDPGALALPDYKAPSMAEQEAHTETELKDMVNNCPLPPLESTIEEHAKEFMEAAKKLQKYFISLDHHQPTKAEILRKEIDAMEEELKKKNELIEKNERLIEGWKMELKNRLDEQNAALERV